MNTIKKLNKKYLDLYNSVQSLMTITEGENLDKNLAFYTLCSGIDRICEEHHDFKRGLSYNGYSSSQDSAKTQTIGPSHSIVEEEGRGIPHTFIITEEERNMIVESLYNISSMMKVGDHRYKEYERLAREFDGNKARVQEEEE